jgi:hypothetical protein
VLLPSHVVAVFDLQAMEVYDEPRRQFPKMLKQLLQLKSLAACGSQIGDDCAGLKKIHINIDSCLS